MVQSTFLHEFSKKRSFGDWSWFEVFFLTNPWRKTCLEAGAGLKQLPPKIIQEKLIWRLQVVWGILLHSSFKKGASILSQDQLPHVQYKDSEAAHHQNTAPTHPGCRHPLGAGPHTIQICHKHRELGKHSYFDAKMQTCVLLSFSNFVWQKTSKLRCSQLDQRNSDVFRAFPIIFNLLGVGPQTSQISSKSLKAKQTPLVWSGFAKSTVFAKLWQKNIKIAMFVIAFPSFSNENRRNTDLSYQ